MARIKSAFARWMVDVEDAYPLDVACRKRMVLPKMYVAMWAEDKRCHRRSSPARTMVASRLISQGPMGDGSWPASAKGKLPDKMEGGVQRVLRGNETLRAYSGVIGLRSEHYSAQNAHYDSRWSGDLNDRLSGGCDQGGAKGGVQYGTGG